MQVDMSNHPSQNLVGNNFVGFEKVMAFECFQGYTTISV
jgi:hypothetical protein